MLRQTSGRGVAASYSIPVVWKHPPIRSGKSGGEEKKGIKVVKKRSRRGLVDWNYYSMYL